VTSDSGSDDVAAQMLTVDARRVVLVITGLYLLAFLALLPFWGWLGRHDHRVWLWTALAGAVLGLLALPLIRKHTGEGRLG
jgi:MFS family permease